RDQLQELGVGADVLGDEPAEGDDLELFVAGVAQRPVDHPPRVALASVPVEGFGVGEGDEPGLSDVVGDRHRLATLVDLVARLLLFVDDAHRSSHSATRAPPRRPERSPSSRICVATAAIASTAAQASEPPTLIRRAPAAAISATVRFGRASTFTGRPT